MDKDKLLEIAAHLRKLGNKEIEPIRVTAGLCINLEKRFSESDEWFLMSPSSDFCFVDQWPKYSGDPYYPVPCPVELEARITSQANYEFDDVNTIHEACYDYYLEHGAGWNIDDPYGALRLELCLWIAEQIEERVRDE